MNTPTAKASITIKRPREETFWYVVPIPLGHIFKKYKYLPGVTSTSVTDEWRTPGLTRTVTFDNGTTAQETLTDVTSPDSFSYKISRFTSMLKFLAREIRGTWIFTQKDERTTIVWTYEIIPTNTLAALVLQMVVVKDIAHLLDQALHTIKTDLETSPNH